MIPDLFYGEAIMSQKSLYEKYFSEPISSKHRQYETLRSRFVDQMKVKDIAKKYGYSFFTVQDLIKNFKKSCDKQEQINFFVENLPGPKADRKKSDIKNDVIVLRNRGYASTDIQAALKLKNKNISISLVEQVIREEKYDALSRRTREKKRKIEMEIASQQIPGFTIAHNAKPKKPEVADVRKINLHNDKKLYSRVAGIFLFYPFLIKAGIDKIVQRANLPGTKMIPSLSYLLSALSLKLLDKERESHINDWNFDETLGLFAKLNILPKSTAITDYSYRLVNGQHNKLMKEWVKAVNPILNPDNSRCFSLDFHSIAHRGENNGLENHYVPTRGKATSSVLTFFARIIDVPMVCYANADILSKEKNKMVLDFVDYWNEITGLLPEWLYFDSKVTTYEYLNELNIKNISFITIRRRGAAMLRNALAQPRAEWKTTTIDTPKRKNKTIKVLDGRTKLKGYDGDLRQLVVDGLGRESPTFFMTNNFDLTAREIFKRYTLRNYIENDIGINVNFFHQDCLCSEVRLNVDFDIALTVIANNCYRWLNTILKGYEKLEPKTVYRKIVETGGHVTLEGDQILVEFDRRSHNPLIAQAFSKYKSLAVPWLENKKIKFDFA